MIKPIIKPFLLSVFTALLSCAKQGFPPGGPEDRTPPEIIRTEPAQGQVNVPPGKEILVWFSEGVRPSALVDAVFFSPNPGDGVQFSWSGKRLRIRFPRPFPDSTTVVVTLGTGIQDYRGNAMRSSYTLAFSTAAHLDQGKIHGTVYTSGSASGLDVWAYSIKSGEDPDPRRMEPNYAVQCQTSGGYAFVHLSSGKYRLYAVRDQARDRLYQPMEDEIGIPFKDVVLWASNQISDSVSFRMIREDTLGPALVRAFAPNRNQIILQFDKAVLMPHPWSKAIRIEPSDSAWLKAAYLDPLDSKRICILTGNQRPKTVYALRLDSLTDLEGNSPDSAVQRIRLESSDRPDTTIPRLVSVQPKNGDRSVNVDCDIRLVFSEPMDTLRSKMHIALLDSSGRAIDSRHQWDSPASFNLFPAALLKSVALYKLSIGDSVSDAFGNALKDTVVQFRTLNTDTLSDIAGSVVDLQTTGTGALQLSIRQVEDRNRFYQQALVRPGGYHFDMILPGRYILDCYRDEDGNGRYSYGRSIPFKPSERFTVYPDTLIVRSRWPNEGNHLVLP